MPDADWYRPINLSDRGMVRRLRYGFTLGAAAMLITLAWAPLAIAGVAFSSRLFGAVHLWAAPAMLWPLSVWLLTPAMGGEPHRPVSSRTRCAARALAIGLSVCAASVVFAPGRDSVVLLALGGLGFNVCAATLMPPLAEHLVLIARSVPKDRLAHRASTLLDNLRFVFGCLFVLNLALAPVAVWDNWSAPEIILAFAIGALAVVVFLVLAVALALAAALWIAFDRALAPLMRAAD
jgi:hypothetical protein